MNKYDDYDQISSMLRHFLSFLRFLLLGVLLTVPLFPFAQTIWTGNESSEWTDPLNWSDGLPNSTNFAIIPGEPIGDFLPRIEEDTEIDFKITNANILTLFGNITIQDSLINYEDGSILNFGLFENQQIVDNDGDFFSAGDILNAGLFDNSGVLTFDFGDNFINQPSGTLTNFGKLSLTDTYFANNGTLLLNGDTLHSSGFIENFGTINNNSVIENTECGVISNQGTINNSFIINNENIIYNEGTIAGNAINEKLSLYNAETILSADEECLDGEGWTHFSHSQSGKLILSIFTNGVDIGSLADQSLTIQIKNDPNLGSGQALNLSDALYSDSDDWYLLNRSWIIKSNVNDNLNMKIRFYFNDIDVADIQNTFPLTQGLEELFFYEIKDSEDAYASNVTIDDIRFFAPDQLSNNELWEKKGISFSSFAELETQGLSGAYSAGIKSWLGGTIPSQISFDLSLDQNNQATTIEWSTSQEQANDTYTVQRSTDGIQFTDLTTISAQGNTTSLSEYSEIDESPDLLNENFYRIKLTRSDGSLRFSATRSLRFGIGEIELFPNPATDELYLSLPEIENGNASVKIFDMNGKLRLQDEFPVFNGITTENILEGLSLEAGIYSLQIEGLSKKQIYRFVKVNIDP